MASSQKKTSEKLWQLSKSAVTLILFVTFLYSSYVKLVIYLAKKKSTIEWIDVSNSKLAFPSLTLCPVFKADYYNQEQLSERNLTKHFTEIAAPLEKTILLMRHNFDSSTGQNLTIMGTNMNRSEHVEEYLFPSFGPGEDQMLRCLKYAPPSKSSAGIMNRLEIIMNTTSLRYIYLALHKEGQFFISPVSFAGAHISFVNPGHSDTDRLNSTHIMAPVSYIGITENKFVRYYEGDNCVHSSVQDHNINECFNKHLAAKTKCRLPWDRKNEGRFCDTKKEYELYKDIGEFLFYADEAATTNATNCSLTCDTHIFETNILSDFEKIPLEAAEGDMESAVILGYFLETTSVPVTEENLEYLKSTLIADIGGYLGLLLGESILSIYHYLVNVKRSRVEKCFGKN